MNDGVEVILDKWDLLPGQDKYVFMEQTVNASTVERVLLVCDKMYMQKANSRKGGVGEETMIISSEIYGQVSQDKFVPVIFESDENGDAYLPAYIKSRFYIDLTSLQRSCHLQGEIKIFSCFTNVSGGGFAERLRLIRKRKHF